MPITSYLLGFVKKITEGLGGLVVPTHLERLGEAPPITFSKLRDYYLGDPDVKDAIDDFVDMVTGPGFYTTAASEEAKEVVDEFNERNELDGLLRYVVTELAYSGNSFLELIEPENLEFLQPIELTSITKIRRDRYGRVLGYVQRVGGEEKELPPNRVVHLAWNPVDRGAFGVGLLHPLAIQHLDPEGEVVPPLLDIKLQLINDMRRALHRYPGRNIYIFPHASDRFIVEQAQKIREMRPGDDFITNREVRVEEVGIDPRSRFDRYIDFIEGEVIIGLQSPSKKLKTTPGYTEASARAVLEMYERRVRAFQRFLARKVERIWAALLKQRGIDPREARVRLRWGQPDMPSISFSDMMRAFEAGAIRREELRRMLSKAGWELVEGSLERG